MSGRLQNLSEAARVQAMKEVRRNAKAFARRALEAAQFAGLPLDIEETALVEGMHQMLINRAAYIIAGETRLAKMEAHLSASRKATAE